MTTTLTLNVDTSDKDIYCDSSEKEILLLNRLKNHSLETFIHSYSVKNILIDFIRKEQILNIKDAELLINAALFHDIGKLLIPSKYLHFPGKLNFIYSVIVNSHTLLAIPLLWYINKDYLPICLFHHHPHTYEQKIVKIIDVYSALTLDRCYRKALDKKTALKIMLQMQMSKSCFDENLLIKFFHYALNFV